MGGHCTSSVSFKGGVSQGHQNLVRKGTAVAEEGPVLSAADLVGKYGLLQSAFSELPCTHLEI